MNFILLKDYVDIKGDKGEEMVTNVLKDFRGYLLNDYTFFHRRTSVQVDHILILESGIYIIETKNWSGRIVGEEWDEYWTQYNGSKKQMYNPVLQNWRHIERLKDRLREFFSLDNLPIYSIIVLPNPSARIEISNLDFDPPVPRTPIVTLARLRRMLRNRETRIDSLRILNQLPFPQVIPENILKENNLNDKLLTPKQMLRIYQTLDQKIYTKISKEDHQANVKFYRRKGR